MTELQFRPINGRLDEIVEQLMQTAEISDHPSLSYTIRLVSEEIIVNIIHYAYAAGADTYLILRTYDEEEMVCIEFRDGGKPFNPLDKELPDVTLPPEQRDIGGLGIFLVCEMMDKVEYTYTEGENRLVIKKKYIEA